MRIPRRRERRDGGECVLTISDLHCKWQHRNALEFLLDLNAKYNPTRVICLGDHGDAYNWSGFDKNPAVECAADELKGTRRELAKFTKAFPKAMVCDSNHVRRFFRGVAALCSKTEGEILGTPPGWVYAESWVVDGVRYIHGDGFGGAKGCLEAAVAHRQSVVHGHAHTFGGVIWSADAAGVRFFGANAGCLINPDAPVFDYAKYNKNKPTLGTVVVDRGVPVFEPMWG